MRKQFSIRTEMHVAELGDDLELHFIPEVYGDQFLDAYAQLQDAQSGLGADGKDVSGLSGDKLRALYGAIREFLKQLMTEESAKRFANFVVEQGGKTVADFRTREEAEQFASGLKGATRVVDESLRLPDRVLIELMEWAVELYGSGSGGGRPTGSSSGSAPASSKAGTPSRAASRSKASMSTAGRSGRS